MQAPPFRRCRLSRATSQEQVSQGWHPQPAPKPGPTLALPLRCRYRIHPHPHQGKALAKTFGCARVVRNRCKPRSNRQNIRSQSNAFRGGGGGGKLRLTRVGGIPMAWSRPLLAVASSVTLTRDCAGRCCASSMVAVERPQLEPSGNAMAVAPGLAPLAVTRDGVKIAPPTVLRAAFQRIRERQRSPGRKVRGANNRATARFSLASAHATVVDQRLDPLHKLGTQLIREHRTLCIEHLNGPGMVKNRKPARSMADAGWCLLTTPLVSRARRWGRTVQVVSRWQPTSLTCWECGDHIGKLPLSKRQWPCPDCRTGHDPGVNAAQTILAAALAARVNAGGSERPSGWPAAGREAGTHLNGQVRRWIA